MQRDEKTSDTYILIIQYSHAACDLDGLGEVALVGYLHDVAPDALVVLGEHGSGVLDLGRAGRGRARVLGLLVLAGRALPVLQLGATRRGRLVPTLRRRCRQGLAVYRLVQHAYPAREPGVRWRLSRGQGEDQG